ncbi:ATP-binding cassette domain-containing protein [uncultured Vibrio sp.]|uniref:ABC transporter ATP-binding protein n=1 Tax=uncultured Vibrio sp. TaxID=114054 RepID=UPI002620104E|nr:ATP-binding cassette domain-containing protein [uncultured Vibrio sp.]
MIDTASELALSVEKLNVRSAVQQLVFDLSLKLFYRQPLTILGETGSGKSILAHAIVDNLPSELSRDGLITIPGLAPCQSVSDSWGKHISLLPQEPQRALDPIMRGQRQISVVDECVKGHSEKQGDVQAMQRLESLALSEHAHKIPSQLSGGMAQRLSYLCATQAGGKILIADEPTKGLDKARCEQITQLLKTHLQQQGALLTITHDVEFARELGGEVIVMKEGRIVERGDAESILNAPNHSYTQALIAASQSVYSKPRLSEIDEVIVRCHQLSVARNQQTLVQGLDLEIRQGEILGVSGDSGAGKSTLGDVILGLVKPANGEVWRGETLRPAARMLKLYQDPPAAFPEHISLKRALLDVCHLHGVETRLIAPLIEKVKLDPEILQRTSREVSGGELQRIALVRALLLKPKLLVADEPTSRLDPIVARQINQLILQVCKEIGCTLILISHDQRLLSQVCHATLELGSENCEVKRLESVLA